MATTRMRTSSSVNVFHRIASVGDMPQHDVSTTDTVAAIMSGGSANFQVEGDETVVHVNASQVHDASESAIGSAAISSYIYIKNTGFTSSAKTTATTSTITVGVGGTFANGGFTLIAGEAITLHGLGGGSDNLSEFQIDSSSGDVYVEIIYL